MRKAFRRAIERPQHFVPTAEGSGAAERVSDVHLDVLEYLLGGVTHGCYRGSMTVFRHDYDLLTGMHAASTVALSCAGTISAIAAVWTMSERRSSRQPRCSGYSANLPPHQWACAPAGSKGLKKTLINISASLFSLPGTSPDIPVVWRIQFRCSTTDFAEIGARHPTLCVATCLQHRTREVRVQAARQANSTVPSEL